jgi:penicillin-binding protein 1A
MLDSIISLEEFQQYYPTYRFKERDILLIEFEEAQRIANSQTKTYGQLANLLLAIATLSLTAFLQLNKTETVNIKQLLTDNLIVISFIYSLFGLLILRYFIELQRSIVINGRKVITLRTMLGLDYGHLQLTLPNWRVEGANNPFVIRLFPGWLSMGSIPYWIMMISSSAIWYFSIQRYQGTPNYGLYGVIFIIVVYSLVFRKFLNDRHETLYLHFCRIICSVLRIKLLNQFEYIIYRAKLAVNEMNRLKFKTDNLKSLLIAIEDHDFYQHHGVSLKSVGRAIFSQFSMIRKSKNILKSGGSTITMQLIRTLFIPSGQNPFTRKVMEILLSIWFEFQFSKKEILDFYIASVRYETGCLGLAKGSEHFFGSKKRTYSNEEAFLLIERLSNIRSSFNPARVKHLSNRVLELINIQLSEIGLTDLYNQMEKKGILKRI